MNWVEWFNQLSISELILIFIGFAAGITVFCWIGFALLDQWWQNK